MIGFVICLILRSAKATLEWFDGLFGSAGRHSLVPNDVWVSLLILRSAEATTVPGCREVIRDVLFRHASSNRVGSTRFFTAYTSFSESSWLCVSFFETIEISLLLVRKDDLLKKFQIKFVLVDISKFSPASGIFLDCFDSISKSGTIALYWSFKEGLLAPRSCALS